MKKLLYNTNEKFIYGQFEATEQEELLAKMSEVLITAKFVKESYKEAVIAREKVFPTGLPTKGISVAIPHTDSAHVIHEGLLVGVANHPITFGVMASAGEYVDIEIAFVLAIKEPAKQLAMLQQLIGLCQDEPALKMLKEGTDIEKITLLLQSIIQ